MTIVATKHAFAKGNFRWRARAVPDEACRAASGGEALELSASTVSRGVIVLERDAVGEVHTVEHEADIALARCPHCGTRRRVLPCDVLPYKRYGLAVMAEQLAGYATGSWSRSLREVAWNLLGERTPSHTTLHGWTEGLGAHALGLPGGEAGGSPFSRFLAEAAARDPAVWAQWEAQPWVDERRYRSDARCERLSALARVMALAPQVSGAPAVESLAACRRLALGWSDSCVLGFPSRLFDTGIEQGGRADRRGSGHRDLPSPPPCLIRTRSPPGASSKSPR